MRLCRSAPYLAEIGQRTADSIETAIHRGGPMATGPAKVIDNAIIGFMQASRRVTAILSKTANLVINGPPGAGLDRLT